jgi:hypothetical protein
MILAERDELLEHTPGPWRLDLHFLGEDHYRCIAAGLSAYYWDRKEATGFSLTGYMSQADASLIASAPRLLAERDALLVQRDKLLAALEKAFMDMGRMGANPDLEHPCRLAWIIAREAIAKVQS